MPAVDRGRDGQRACQRPADGRQERSAGLQTYGRLIGYPMLKPHDLRHGVAMEAYEQHDDLEMRGLLGYTRIETTQLSAQFRRPHSSSRGVLRGEGARRPEQLTRRDRYNLVPQRDAPALG
jgi:hypothetical protein